MAMTVISYWSFSSLSKVTSARTMLQGMERDMKRVPQLGEVVRALKDALHAIDKAEARSPQRLSDDVLTHSRFQQERKGRLD